MKKLLAYFAVLCLMLSCQVITVSAEETQTAVVENNAFSDVDATTEVGKDIYKLYHAGIISGHGNGTFAPNDPVTRAQLCKMVNNILGLTEPDTTGFVDVTEDKWYYQHVLIGKKAGYIKGYPDGTFLGDNYITREQVSAIICRAFSIPVTDATVTITDPVSEWAVGNVTCMVVNNLIPLEEGNTFRALENMTRAELSVVLAKFLKEEPDKEEKDEEKKDELPYVITVKDTKGTITDAVVSVEDNKVKITLPAGKTLSTSNQVTVTVLDKDGKAVKGVSVTVTDSKNVSKTGTTNTSGQIALPAKSSTGGGGGGGGGSSSGGGGGGGGSTVKPSDPEPEDPTPDNPDPEDPAPEDPEPDEMTTEEIIAANQEVLKYLKAVRDDLTGARFTGKSRQIVNIVLNCVNDAIAIGESGQQLISKDFVYTNYDTEIAEAKAIYHSLSEEGQAAFVDAVSKEVGQETQDYLIAVFL